MNKFLSKVWALPATTWLTAILCVFSHCLQGYALNLDKVVELALQHDAQLQADRYTAKAQRAEGWQSVAAYGPSLSASAAYMRSRDVANPEDRADEGGRSASFDERNGPSL